jgi:hypothetical protein
MSFKREVEPRESRPSDQTVRRLTFPTAPVQRIIPKRSSGWDPYEVWRTRVKTSEKTVEANPAERLSILG